MKKLLLLSAFLIAGFSVGVKNADAKNVCEYPVVGWLAEQFGWWGCDHKNGEISNTIDHSQAKDGLLNKHGGVIDGSGKANASKECVDEVKKGTGNEIRATEKKPEEGIHKATEEIKKKAQEVDGTAEKKIDGVIHNTDQTMTKGAHNMDDKVQKMTEEGHDMEHKIHDNINNVERKIDEATRSLPSHNSGSTSDTTHKPN